jgi:NitT/TauT family transport system ATP-binding protein
VLSSENTDANTVSRPAAHRSVAGPDGPPGEPLLEVRHVEIGYEVEGSYNVAVGDVSFEIWPGETLILLGPSGCGKSTLLKAIAGFLEPQAGTITFAGRHDLQPGPDRAVVFQEFDQLFPWRTVADNVSYPLRVNGRSKQQAAEAARGYIEMMRLSDAADRFPHQLSGGMKQRVAIARAFALEPEMLLMDEPFGSLDAQTRSRLQRELMDIVNRTKVTTLFVTHSIQEALLLGHRIVVLGQPPSVVKEVVDVTEIDDPDTSEFVKMRRHLRELLAEKGEDVDHALFE